jgi:peptidoglycan/xylan/chitin deacetylase (PgdA/CDA1 family)
MFHRLLVIFCFYSFAIQCVNAQVNTKFYNSEFLSELNNTRSYVQLKNKYTAKYAHYRPGRWGEFVTGVCEDLKTNQRVVAFTFDACGGEKGTGYDGELIDFLKKEQIPATIFVTGRWIDAHPAAFHQLACEKLFEIENHGLNHRPCSLCGHTVYGIKGTANVSEAIDEMEANARKIEALTGRRPIFYRSATAFIDEACVSLARDLKITAVSYHVLSGDAWPSVSKKIIHDNVMKNLRPGAIVIMHMNHPRGNTFEALRVIVPELRKEGYRFVLLKDYKLTNRIGTF